MYIAICIYCRSSLAKMLLLRGLVTWEWQNEYLTQGPLTGFLVVILLDVTIFDVLVLTAIAFCSWLSLHKQILFFAQM